MSLTLSKTDASISLMTDWLRDRTILLTIGGSHAYGMATESSDLDVKGICVPPMEYYLGFVHEFAQTDSPIVIRQAYSDVIPDRLSHAAANKLEGAVYELRKFMRLASDCNPNILEVLFCEDADILLATQTGELLRQHREMFLSRRARARYQGYAMSQLHLINTHRGFLLNPEPMQPRRSDYGLNEQADPAAKEQLAFVQAEVQKRMDHWNNGSFLGDDDLEESTKIRVREGVAQFLAELGIAQSTRELAAMQSIGFDDSTIALLQKERAYRNAMNRWQQYQKWLKDRNPARAALEAKHGFDTKNGAHLVRLLVTCKELVSTGQLRVRRDDAEFLLGIRSGAWSYDQLIDWAGNIAHEIDVLMPTSPLPAFPDKAMLNKICVQISNEMVGGL